MSYLRSVTLALFALTLFVVSISGDAMCQQTPCYEVATIRASKPDSRGSHWNQSINRLSIQNYTLRNLIRQAYGLKSDSQIIGGPKWLDDKHFDIEAKVDDEEVAKIRSLSNEDSQTEHRLMLQALLAQRFKLSTASEVQNLPVYALVVAKSKAKLSSGPPLADSALKMDKQVPASPVAASQVSDQPKPHLGYRISGSRGHVSVTTISIDAFADWLTHQPETGNRVVLNKTGLTGDYSFEFTWAPDHGAETPEDAPDPGLFTALKEELGLELKAERSHVEVIVVQSVSEPTLD